MGLFGGDNDKNKFQFGIDGEKKTLYTTVDSETGEITIYEDKGFDTLGRDIKLGTIKPGEQFVPHEGGPLGGIYPDGYSDVFVGENAKYFQSKEGLKELRAQAEKTARLGCEEASDGNTPEACAQRASELIESGKVTTPPDADADDVAQETLKNLPISAKKGTRRSFGDLRYPIDMDKNQDVMKFTMLKYETKDLMEGGTFGFGNRDRVGPNGDARATGTVVLPIQSGIKDQNGADWGDNKMNAFDIAKASGTLGLLGDQSEANAIDKIVGAVQGNTAATKEGIKQFFAQKASGVTGLLQRTRGATVNPNLELLFNEPTLRPFSFNFKLSARSKKEAEEIVKIIRFFKQGMAPIRTESNLFLLAPHTFQIHYLLRGQGEHPFVGKMKECALTSMTTDYTPENNYSTTRDGFMTSYSITMEFKELEPVFNDDYENEDTVNQLTPEIGPPVPGGVNNVPPSLEIGF